MAKKKKKVKTANVVLAVLTVLLVTFVVAMIVTFWYKGSIPDVLCTCVFAIAGGECGVLGWIKTTKEKKLTRQYEIEDRKYNRKEE